MTQKLAYNILSNILPLFLIFHLSYGLYEIEVHRMFGYEQGEQIIGSRIHSFTMMATHFAGDALRKLAVIKLNEINSEQLETLLQKKPSGILIILPSDGGEHESQTWKTIYTYLAPKSENLAIYFCWETQQALRLYDESKGQHQQQVQLSGSEPKQLNQLVFEDIYASYEDLNLYRQSQPTILIAVGGDQELPSQDIQIPFENQGQQLLLFLQLAKSLKSVYQSYNKREFNIIFYYESTSTLNHEGLKKFFEKPENQRITNAIEVVLFLDTIYSRNDLYLDFQLSTNDEAKERAQRLVQVFSQTLSKSFELNLREIDSLSFIRNKDLSFMRLSSKSSDEEFQLLQKQQNFIQNFATLHNAVYQSLLKTIYGLDQIPASNGLDQQLDSTYSDAIYSFVNNTSRHVVNLQKDTKYTAEINKIFSGVFKSTQKSPYVYRERKYFSSSPGKAQVIQFISAFLDLYFFIGVLGWLSVVYFVFRNFSILREMPLESKKRR